MTNQWLISIFFVSVLVPYLLFVIVEPIFIFLYNRPIYVHLYLLPQKLSMPQREILKQFYPFYNALSSRNKQYFEHRVVQFINRYQFVGQDIEVTQDMKLVIAGTYVMLTFGLRKYLISAFKTIIVYPQQYKLPANDLFHKGEYNAQAKIIVFSWEDFLLGLQSYTDTINLGLHEFGHALHFHGLKGKDASAIVFSSAYDKVISFYHDPSLKRTLQQKKLFRAYAFLNEFEFMAVVFEYFFESPQQFKKKHPTLYENVTVMLNVRFKF